MRMVMRSGYFISKCPADCGHSCGQANILSGSHSVRESEAIFQSRDFKATNNLENCLLHDPIDSRGNLAKLFSKLYRFF